MARSDPQLNFRIPAELRDKLEAAAKMNNRSLTGELIARLEISFDADALSEDGAVPEAIREMKQRLEEIAALVAQRK